MKRVYPLGQMLLTMSLVGIMALSLNAADKDYTLTLSGVKTSSEVTQAGAQSHSDGYMTMASLSRNFSNGIIGTAILGYSNSDTYYDMANSDAHSDTALRTYGLSVYKVLNPLQYVGVTVVYNDIAMKMAGLMNANTTDYANDSSDLVSTITFMQVIPFNQKFYAMLDASISNQKTNYDAYSSGAGQAVSKSSITRTYGTVGFSPTYMLNSDLSAGVNFKYYLADRSFFLSDNDVNYYSAGFTVSQKLNETWSVGLNGTKQYGLKDVKYDSAGLNVSVKF